MRKKSNPSRERRSNYVNKTITFNETDLNDLMKMGDQMGYRRGGQNFSTLLRNECYSSLITQWKRQSEPKQPREATPSVPRNVLRRSISFDPDDLEYLQQVALEMGYVRNYVGIDFSNFFRQECYGPALEAWRSQRRK